MSEAAVPGRVRAGAGVSGLFSDERLARRATEGDKGAFGAIFRRYHQSLYRYCLAIVGEPQDAHDALQNTMVKVLRALPGEKRQIELKPWLYRIAHNESIAVLRRRRQAARLDPELVSQGPGLAEEAEARERLRRLIVDLDELPDRQRGALVMRELAGLGFDEIGAALGTSPAVARQTLYEARLSLGQMEAGREMTCEAVTRALSDADGRVTRRRDIRAHLRSCSECRRFRDGIAARERDLSALAPLPALAAAGLLKGLLGGQAGAGGIAGALGGGAAKSLGGAAALKATATVAVVAAIGAGTVDRGGLVDLGLPGGGDSPAMRSAGPSAGRSATEEPLRAVEPRGAPAIGAGVAGFRVAEPRRGGGRVEGSRPASTIAEEPVVGATPTPGPPGSSPARPDRRGAEKQLPSAADHGQQTAAAHKAGKAAKSGAAGSRSHGEPAAVGKAPHPTHPSSAAGAKDPPAPPAASGGGREAHSPAGAGPPAAGGEEAAAVGGTGKGPGE